MGQLVNDTLSAWLLIESLNPGEVSYTTDDLLSQKHFKNIVQQVQLHSLMSTMIYGMMKDLLSQMK